ncbi:TPA: hypothetical protein ACKREV_000444 [Providencia stuartii]
MKGSFPLSNEEIDKQVDKNRMGNYAIGYTKDGNFHTTYVGRSDTDVNARLKKHVGKHGNSKRFRYDYASSVTAAFERECENYHKYKGSLTNDMHPDQPDEHGKTIYCPVSSCEKSKPKDKQ